MKLETRLKNAKPDIGTVDVTEKVMQKITKKRLVSRPAWSWAFAAMIAVPALPLAVSVTNALTHGYWDDYMSVMQQTGKTVTLPNGNRVITLDASLCGTYGVASSFDSTKNNTTTNREYYEIKKDSGVTDQDVINWRKTNCEASLVSSQLQEIGKSLTIPEGKALVNAGLTVAAIDDSYADLYVPEFHYEDMTTHEPKSMPEVHYIFRQSLKETKVVDVPAVRIGIGNLKVGDFVTVFVAVDKSLLPEYVTCNGYTGGDGCILTDIQKTDNPGTILAIMRQPSYDSGLNSPVQLGSNFFTVVPCKTSMNGLCASGEMNQKGEYTHPTPLVGWPVWQLTLLGGVVLVVGAVFVLRTFRREK